MAKVIEFEIEEAILAEIDEAAAKIGVSRTVFITAAIKHALRHHYIKDLSQEDEANTFRLWLADDDDIDGWGGALDWVDPSDGLGDDRLN